jgi:hypothetical protein
LASLREKIRRNAARLLNPGEEIQAVIPAQLNRGGQHDLGGGKLVLIATDRRILLCTSGPFRITPVRKLLGELPRATTIGPAHGIWYRCDTLGMPAWIHRRFFKDISAADAARTGAASPW